MRTGWILAGLMLLGLLLLPGLASAHAHHRAAAPAEVVAAVAPSTFLPEGGATMPCCLTPACTAPTGFALAAVAEGPMPLRRASRWSAPAGHAPEGLCPCPAPPPPRRPV